MKNTFSGILTNAKARTGIDAAVFTAGGDFYCGNRALAVDFRAYPVQDFDGDVLQKSDENLTYFLFRKGHSAYVGALRGTDAISRNYALLLLTLFENALSDTKPPLTRAEKFRMYLCGELTDQQLSALKAEYRDDSCNYYVLTLVTETMHKMGELRGFLEAIAERDDIVVPYEDKAVAFFKKCGDEDEYQSANDFAYTLYDNIKEELRITITVNVGGTAHSFDDLSTFFKQCVFAYSFGRLLSPGNNIYSYKEYIMIKMLSDIPKQTLSQYLDTLLDKNSLETISDEELMTTAEEFLKNSLNISETSRSMYMHRNTLIYRLDKIEKATGLNIRHFNDAVIFKLITILHKLTTGKN